MNFSQQNEDYAWRNVYWFARMLINSDKYGGMGKENPFLTQLAERLDNILTDKSVNDETKILDAKLVILNSLEKRFTSTGIRDRVQRFYNDLSVMLLDLADIAAFTLTLKLIMIPIKIGMAKVPNDDREYAEREARLLLDAEGENGLSTVINLWDDLGLIGCLNREREIVTEIFGELRTNIRYMKEQEQNVILTAFTQEFERRLGQKRKGRAGGSLENVTSFIFDYFDIKAASQPEHFQADIEIDKWIRCADGWLIGISCKRTLRERWKQVSSADRKVLSKYKIKQIWHVITYDEDLSDDKLTLLGGLDHVFYLREDSRRYIHAAQHIGMKGFVRPIRDLISDIRKEQS